MTSKDPEDGTAAEFERALSDRGNRFYRLRLYISGLTPRSVGAVDAIKAICEQHLAGRYDLEVVDLYQQPQLARKVQVIAAPTLVKELPEPVRRLIGDMKDQEKVLIGLDIQVTDP